MMKSTAVLSVLLHALALPCAAQPAQPVQPVQPIAVGESLRYTARIGSLAGGSGELRIEGLEHVRGRETHVLSFEFEGGAGPLRMRGGTRSWLDVASMSALRFRKQERSPLGTSADSVEMFPAEGVWHAADGRSGAMTADDPLDELSFLYYVRTLPLEDGSKYDVARHFDAGRNPVTIRVTGRQRLRVPAGEYDVVVVEMVVPAGNHVKAGAPIRLYLTDDERRVPVRIETSVRLLGRVVLTLVSCNRHAAVAGR